MLLLVGENLQASVAAIFAVILRLHFESDSPKQTSAKSSSFLLNAQVNHGKIKSNKKRQYG